MSILSFFRKSAPAPRLPKDDDAMMRLYKKLRWQSFIAGTVGYSLYYVCRTSLNVVKKPILESGALDATQLGVIGSALLFAYAIGKFVNGFLSDHSNIKRFMAAGLAVSAVANLLVGILGIYFHSAPEGGQLSMNILEISKHTIPMSAQYLFFPLTFVGFGVLGAMFPFHTWSPDGHASAPTAVSMLHAGVLMKLGGYGCFRVAIFLMPEAANELAWIFLTLTGISVVYGAFSAIKQTDLKYINAYSSVSHCGLVLFAILMLNQTAMTGAVLQMLSHGLMTALFFALIGMIYGRTHTRDVREMGGLMKVMPFLSVCFVIAGLASLGLPGLSGFVAEMTAFVGSFEHTDTFHRFFTILATTSIVITAVYVLRMVGKLLYGAVQNPEHLKLTDATFSERFSVATLIVAIAGLGMVPLWVSDMISYSLIPVIEQLTR